MTVSTDFDFDAAIAHSIALAEECERAAAWDREIGIAPVGVMVAKDHQAVMHRRSARAHELERETGKPHCVCCLMPKLGPGGHR